MSAGQLVEPAERLSVMPVLDPLRRAGAPARPGSRPRSSRRACRPRSGRRGAAGRRAPISSTSPDRHYEPDAAQRRRERLQGEAEPCVQVPIAPAMPWVSISPWFASARPASHSGGPNAPTVVPGSAVARPVPASTREHALQPVHRQQRAVGEVHGRERVAGRDAAHLPGAADGRLHLGLGRRRHDLRRAAGLVADPVRERRHQAPHPSLPGSYCTSSATSASTSSPKISTPTVSPGSSATGR